MAYTFGTKGAQGGRQIAPGLPRPSCNATNLVVNQTNIYDAKYSIAPLNDLHNQMADWSLFTNNATNSFSPTANLINSNNLTPYTGSPTGNNPDGFPVVNGDFLATVMSDANKGQVLAIIDFSDVNNPKVTSQTVISAGNGATELGATSRIFPCGDTSLIMVMTRSAGDATGMVNFSVYRVDITGVATLDSTGNSFGSTSYIGFSEPNSYGGLGAELLPLGKFKDYEQFMTYGTQAVGHLLSYNTVKKTITATDLGWMYNVALFSIRVSDLEVNIIGYFNWQNGGRVCKNSPNNSQFQKRKARLTFNVTDGSYKSYADMSESGSHSDSCFIEAHQSYHVHHARSGNIFGNYPFAYFTGFGSSSDLSGSYLDRTRNNQDDGYAAHCSKSVISPSTSLGVNSEFAPFADMSLQNYGSYANANLVWSLTNQAVLASYQFQGDAQLRLAYRSKLTGDFAPDTAVTCVVPSGFSNSGYSTKPIILQDKIIILNKVYTDYSNPVKFAIMYPR